MDKITCYKVLSNVDGKLYSASGIHIESKFCIEYKQDSIVYPKITGSYLFVFSCKNFSIDYSNSCVGDIEVWKCECDKLIYYPNPVILYRIEDNIEEFWKNEIKERSPFLPRYLLPESLWATYITPSLKLVSRLS